MPAHPLAGELIEALCCRGGGRVLDFGSGIGRNTAALRDAGFDVLSIDDAAAVGTDALAAIDIGGTPFDGALSTHALLHGTPHSVRKRVGALACVLSGGAYFFATFASTRDARYGGGEEVAEATFAPLDGDERGVAHVYFDELRLRAIVEPHFRVTSLDERAADAIAGTWAHSASPLRGAVHWILYAVRGSCEGP